MVKTKTVCLVRHRMVGVSQTSGEMKKRALCFKSPVGEIAMAMQVVNMRGFGGEKSKTEKEASTLDFKRTVRLAQDR